jgi:hypothetical protein
MSASGTSIVFYICVLFFLATATVHTTWARRFIHSLLPCQVYPLEGRQSAAHHCGAEQVSSLHHDAVPRRCEPRLAFELCATATLVRVCALFPLTLVPNDLSRPQNLPPCETCEDTCRLLFAKCTKRQRPKAFRTKTSSRTAFLKFGGLSLQCPAVENRLKIVSYSLKYHCAQGCSRSPTPGL